MPDPDRRTLSVRPSIWGSAEGVPLAALAALGLSASLFGRLLEPALYGAATGIDTWIGVTEAIAKLLSQIVAVASVAFALRSVGVALARPALGIAYRMTVIPAALAACMLTLAAAANVARPEFGSALAISAITVTVAGLPLVLLLPSSRAVGLALGLTAVSGAFDFAGVRLSSEAYEAGSVALYRVASGLVTCGFLFELMLVTLAFGWLSARRRGRALALGALSAVLALVLVWTINATTNPNASTLQIVIGRSLGSLLRAPAPFVPPAARLMLEAASWVGAVTAIVMTRRTPVAPVLALCLIARGSLDIPIPALLLVVAAVALPAYGAVPPAFLPNDAQPRPSVQG